MPIRTLKQLLATMPYRDLRGVASRLELRRRGQNRKTDWIDTIDGVWQRPKDYRPWLDRLSTQAQAGLRRLLQIEQVPTPLFLAEYGSIRQVTRKHQYMPPPWTAPQTASEELYYLGMLHPAIPPLRQAVLQAQLDETRQKLLDLVDHRVFTPPPHPSDPEMWRATIAQAIDTKHNLQIDYFSAGRNLLTRRLVEPYWIEEHKGAVYLRAYCHQAGQVLTFRLDRIQAIETAAT